MSFFSYGQKYSIGLKVSPLISWPSFGDKEEKEIFSRGVSLGFSGGALVSFPLKKEFDLFLEGAYAQKGRRLKYEDERRTNQSKYKFIDLTMLLRKSYKFRLEKNIPSQFYFQLGPEISYWAGGNGQIIVSNIPYDYEIVFDETPDSDFKKMYMNDVNRWLFGLAIGVGIKAPMLRNQHISTELRFVSGHTFLGDSESSHIEMLTFQDTMKTNLKVISLNISYTLDFDTQKSRMGKSTLKKKLRRNR